MRGLRLAALAAACLMAMMAVGGAYAADAYTLAYAVTMETELGYQGAITYGKTIPMTVVMTNTGSDVEGVLSVDVWQDEMQYDRVETAVSLPAGASKRVVLPVRVMKKQERFTFTYAKGSQMIAQATATPERTVSPYAMLVGVLARDPQALSYMNLTAERDELMRGETWQTITLTKETFPQSADMLSAFGVIAVDGFDARTLDESQRAALDAWIEGGGVLLLGGGAEASVGYPYFEAKTGLSAGALSLAPDITPAVMDYVRMSGEPLGRNIMRNELVGGETALIADDAPIMSLHRTGSGAIYTAAFALSDAPLSSWRVSATMWQRILLTATPDLYANALSSINPDTDMWRVQNALTGISVENNENMTSLFLLLIAFALLATLGVYFLLKKLDRREWLWAAIPILSLGMAAIVWGMSQNTTMNHPVVVSMTQITFDDGQRSAHTYLGVTTADRNGYTIAAPDGETLKTIYESYYDPYSSSEDQGKKTPTQLRYTLRYGSGALIGMPAEAPWSVRYLKAESPLINEGDMTASVWYEEDGLHAELTNATGYEITQGYLITNQGYCSVGRIAPGETIDAAILYPKADKDKASTTITIVDGELLSSGDLSTQSRNVGVYQIINAIVYPEGEEAAYNGTLSAREAQKRNGLMSVLNGAFDYGNDANVCAFIGFNDQIGRVRVAINGSEDVRAAHNCMVKVVPEYEAVGRTGVVYYMPNVLEIYDMETDEDHLHPVLGEKSNIDSYYQATERPVIGCQIPDANQTAWEKLRFTCQYVEGDMRFSLYNFAEDRWDEQPIGYGAEVLGENIAPYISPEGYVAVYAHAGGGTSQDSSSFYRPTFELLGGEKQ